MDSEIEKINYERLKLISSKEYNTGRRMNKISYCLKNFKFFSLIKIIIRHKRINKCSCNPCNYDLIKKNAIDYNKAKIVVYTCITGNYDKIVEPLFVSNNIDYILFTDSNDLKNYDGKWTLKNINKFPFLKGMTTVNKNRYIKMHPHDFFEKKYDFSIYIDGNVQVVSNISRLINSVSSNYGFSMHNHRNRSDIYKEIKACKILKKGNIKKLISLGKKYKNDGFPIKYGMLEANVICCDMKNLLSKKIMNDWWEEFRSSDCGRDQIPLPYVLWKNSIDLKEISTMGGNAYENPIFYIENHNVEGVQL